jgi:hypothetical protein
VTSLHDRQPSIAAATHTISGGGSNALVIVLGTRAPGAAPRARRFRLVSCDIGDRADRGRKEVGDTAAKLLLCCERFDQLLLIARPPLEPLAPWPFLTGAVVAGTILARPFIPRALLTRTVVAGTLLARAVLADTILADTIAALISLTARLALLPILPLGTLLALARLVERFLVALAVEHILVAFVLVVALRRTLILKARAHLAKHAEIMVRELKVIFGLDTVAGELRVAGHVLVLLE